MRTRIVREGFRLLYRIGGPTPRIHVRPAPPVKSPLECLGEVLEGLVSIPEVELTSQLEHPNILSIHDAGEADGFLYYVMPVVEGESLRDRLNHETQLPMEDALQIAKDVAEVS